VPPSPAEPAPSTPPATSLAGWLRARSDRQLEQLLRLRPDLTLPAPPDIATLGGRLAVRTSTQRAVDGLDAPTLAVLERLVLAADADGTVPDANVPAEALAALHDLGLVWGDGVRLHLVATVREAVGPYPAGLGRPAAELLRIVPDLLLTPVLRHLGIPHVLQPAAGQQIARQLADPDRVAALVADVSAAEREVLDRLTAGPPVGTVRNTRLAATGGPELTPAHLLINRGLLVAIDTQRVELPREVGLLLRAAAPPADPVQPPPLTITQREPDDLDRLGTSAVLETLRRVEVIAESWAAQAPAVLRAGGLGVRDLKRTAKEIGVDDAAAAVLVETATAAGLLNSSNEIPPSYLPTPEYDAWRERDTARRWSGLASAWLAMSRQPSLVGIRGDRERVIAALSPDVDRGTIVALRRRLLELLADLPPGSAPGDRSEVLARFAWQQPRRATGQRALAEAVLAEADLLGVTAAGGLTGYSRTLLLGTAAAAEAALSRALPDPVDHFLVQPDLTVVVPGPAATELAAELGLIADLESTGGANVYRITERSVRRALDAGRSGPELATFVAQHSRTPVPQALSYMITDAARRHGVLRAGTAGAYLRCDDAALLARVLADRSTESLHLRQIAPTVVVADASVTRVLDVLRHGGYAPAAEAPGGALLTLTAEAPRAPGRPAGRSFAARSADSDAALAGLVRRLRSGDALAGLDPRVQSIALDVPGVTSATTMELLRTAVREDRRVWLGVAEPNGVSAGHEIEPISLAAGTVRGYERGRAGLVSFPVHRITGVRILDDNEGED
jgi:hypothetical protein